MICLVTPENQHDYMALLPKFFDELDTQHRDQIIAALPTFVSFVAYDGIKPIGIASVSAINDLLLGQVLWVDPDYRRTNAGGLLYRKLCQVNKSAIKTIVVKPERLRLYKKMGYTVEYLVLRKE